MLTAVGTIGPGSVVGGAYRIDRLLGRGGMGSVYGGVEESTGRPVAVKFLEAMHADSEEVRVRFRREAIAASAVNHPSVVKVLASGDDEGTPFLVMELLEGETLADRLAALGRFSAGQTVAVLAPLLEALEVAHAAGVVHRDLKPPNLFLARTPAPVVKVLDFGISRLGGANTRITRTGSVMGTLPYMAPEQVRDSASATAATDLYAVGVIAYELLTGRVPFDSQNDLSLMEQIVGQPPPPLSSLAPDAPPALASLVEGLLAKRPGDRPGGARTVRETLLAAAAPDPSGLFERLPVPARKVKATDQAVAPSGGGRLWALGALGLVLAGATAFAVVSPFGEPPAASPAMHIEPLKPVAVVKAVEPAPVAAVTPPTPVVSVCDALLKQAEGELEARPDLAAIDLNHCLALSPNEPAAYWLWAKRLERIGLAPGRGGYYRTFADLAPDGDPRRHEAQTIAEESTSRPYDPDAIHTLILFAESHRENGEFEMARKAYQQCVYQRPLMAACQFGLGAMYDAESTRAREVEHDLLGLDLDPSSRHAADARKRLDAHYQSVRAALQSGAIKLKLPDVSNDVAFGRRLPRTAWDWYAIAERCKKLQQQSDTEPHHWANFRYRVAGGKAVDLALREHDGSVLAACVEDRFREVRFAEDTLQLQMLSVSY